jgi:hypothetical protein
MAIHCEDCSGIFDECRETESFTRIYFNGKDTTMLRFIPRYREGLELFLDEVFIRFGLLVFLKLNWTCVAELAEHINDQKRMVNR